MVLAASVIPDEIVSRPGDYDAKDAGVFRNCDFGHTHHIAALSAGAGSGGKRLLAGSGAIAGSG